MAHIYDFFTNGSCNAAELASYLDGLAQDQRIAETTSLNKKQQIALWQAVEGNARLTLEDFVPADVPALTEVRHWGQNTLPAFNKFKKIMCRTSDGTISGYNESGFLSGIVGNGYFVTRETSIIDPDDAGVVVDYTFVPREKVATWPEIRPCSEKLGRFVYHNGRDYMRKVSQHVTIGQMIKTASNNWTQNYFMLCRED